MLANGQENSLFKARPVNRERVFIHTPLMLSLGSNHVAYVSDFISELEKNMKVQSSRKKIKTIKMSEFFEDNNKKID